MLSEKLPRLPDRVALHERQEPAAQVLDVLRHREIRAFRARTAENHEENQRRSGHGSTSDTIGTMRRLCLIAAFVAYACHTGPAQETPSDGGNPDAGHALPGPGFAAAWKIADANELVTGPSTGGKKGDWEIANSRVRFVIEDARPSDGFDPYGCSIAAADRQRDAG